MILFFYFDFNIVSILFKFGFNPTLGYFWGSYFNCYCFFIYNVGRMLFVYYIFKIHPFNKNQFIIISLGIITLISCSLFNNIFGNSWIQMIFNSSFCMLLFFGIIYLFSLEKETVNYAKKIRNKLYHLLF